MLARWKEGWVEAQLNDLGRSNCTLRGSMLDATTDRSTTRRWRHCEHQGNWRSIVPMRL